MPNVQPDPRQPRSPNQPAASRFYGLDDSVFEVALHEPVSDSPAVPEPLVQDLWADQRYNRENLATSDGLRLTVLDPGTFNDDGGPDFRRAHLRIDGQEWYGDVEIHLTSATWVGHRHDKDPHYNSVVLHVTLHPDLLTGKLHRADGTRIPELILYPYLDEPIRSLVHRFYTKPASQLPCASGWPTIPAQVRDTWIRSLGVERIYAKKQLLAQFYLQAPNLEALLYEQLMAGLGYARNTEAMRTLARCVPLPLIRALADPLDVEALLFGVAGLLPTLSELLKADRETADYAMDLHDRFQRLSQGLELSPMRRETWQFFRLRPANFPTLRIAQAAALLRATPPGLLYGNSLDDLTQAFYLPDAVHALRQRLAPVPSAFWTHHVRLDRRTKPQSAALGRERADVLITNAIAPAMLLHAEQSGDPKLEEAIFEVLRQLPAERDEVARKFEALGTRARHALDAQGLHQLYRTRCTPAHCLRCEVGRRLLHPTASDA